MELGAFPTCSASWVTETAKLRLSHRGPYTSSNMIEFGSIDSEGRSCDASCAQSILSHQMRRVRFQEDVDDDGESVELLPLLQWDVAAIVWLIQQKEVRSVTRIRLVKGPRVTNNSSRNGRGCGRWCTQRHLGGGHRTSRCSYGVSSWVVSRCDALFVTASGFRATYRRFVFIAMTPEFGLPYFWICIGNLLAVVTLQYLAQSPRPIDLYRPLWQLQDRRCVDEDTRGFPCVDCHMAVVVLLPAILHTQSAVVQLLFVLIVLYIAACKLLLATRFISQVLGSWLMGFTGILIGNHGHVVVKSYKLSRGYK